MPRHARSVRQTLTLDCPRCLGLALSTMSCHRAVRQHRHPILVPLAAMNHDLIALKIYVLDSQPQTLQQPQPRSIQYLPNQMLRAVQLL